MSIQIAINSDLTLIKESISNLKERLEDIKLFNKYWEDNKGCLGDEEMEVDKTELSQYPPEALKLILISLNAYRNNTLGYLWGNPTKEQETIYKSHLLKLEGYLVDFLNYLQSEEIIKEFKVSEVEELRDYQHSIEKTSEEAELNLGCKLLDFKYLPEKSNLMKLLYHLDWEYNPLDISH